MLGQAFEEYREGVSNLPKTLPIAEWEIKVNKLLKEFQVNAGIKEPHLTVANLFIARLNGTIADTLSPALPNGLNLTYLSRDPSGSRFPGYLNQMDILTNKIVDSVTRELFLTPLLVQNFSKPFKINDQMLELLNGLSCADGSKPKLDADSLSKTSAEFVDYLRRFQSADLPPNAAPMSLRQMYGILQSFERFKSFGFAPKQPKAIGACRQDDFGSSPSQFLRFGLYPELEGKFYGDFQDGNIRFSSEGIRQTYTIFHEMLHMFLPSNQFYDAGLIHIDDFKFFKPLLQLSNDIPVTALNENSIAIPPQYTTKEEIGLLDQLLVDSAKSLGRPSSLPPGCNSQFIGPGSVFRKFCPPNMGPILAMTLPYNSKFLLDALMAPPKINPVATTTPTPTQLSQSSDLSLIDPMIMTELYTALARGALQIIATNLKLSKEKQVPLLSLGENASRIGFIAANENINSGTYVAIFSGLATTLKMLNFGFKSLTGESIQEFTKEYVGNMSKKIIGEEMTNKIGTLIGNTPERLKTFTSQLLFVFALHSLSEASKNLENKENKIQTPKIEEKILVALLASACSALMEGIIKLGVDKFFSREQEPSTISGDAEATGGGAEISNQGGSNLMDRGGRSIEVSARLGLVTAPTLAPQLPSTPSSPQQSR
jgi:hypothetical protein